jgi:hypothetical protein
MVGPEIEPTIFGTVAKNPDHQTTEAVSNNSIIIIISTKSFVRFEVFTSGDYEEWFLLGCYAVWLLKEPTFRRNPAPPSSG